MKIRSVYVEVNKKLSKQFQSFGNSVGLSADLEEGDAADAVIRDLQGKAMGLLVKLDDQRQRPQQDVNPVAREYQ
jgi:hypothetical protein